MKKNNVIKKIEAMKNSNKKHETVTAGAYTYELDRNGDKIQVTEYNDSFELVNMYLA